MGLSAARTSGSFLVKVWLAGSEGDEGACGKAGFLYSDVLFSRKSSPQFLLVKPHGLTGRMLGEGRSPGPGGAFAAICRVALGTPPSFSVLSFSRDSSRSARTQKFVF